MNDAFEQGVKYVAENMGAAFGGQIAQQWLSLEPLIKELSETVLASQADPAQLQGNAAETWHSGTLNYSARIHHSTGVAFTPKSHGYGSVDIQAGDKSYSSKYYKTGAETAKAQAKSNYEYFMERRVKALRKGKSVGSLEDFLKERNRSKSDERRSIYDGQYRLIPSDQINGARDYLNRRIQSALANGKLEEAARYQETLDALRTVVEDGKGNTSVGLTREDAQKLVQAVREGKLDKELLEECGIDLNQLVSAQDILHEAFKAGISAAVISLVIGIAPTIMNGISMLIKEGEIDPDLFAEIGYKGLSSTAKGFINGSISAALVACCQSGKLGTALMGADASIISTAVVLMVGTIESGIRFATGKITKAQMADEIARLHITTAFSVAGGLAASVWFAEIPPLAVAAYMLGSFIGGIVGSFAYNLGRNVFVAFCVESGCTFFGVVDQSYELPQEVINAIGIEVFEYEKFAYDTFEADTFQFDSFIPDSFEYDKFGIRILRRGVIEFGKIGYI